MSKHGYGQHRQAKHGSARTTVGTAVARTVADGISSRARAIRLLVLTAATVVAVLAILVLSVRAETLDPYEILEQHAEALGGRERLALHAVSHVVGTLDVSGLSGIVETWSGPGGTRRLEIDFGIFTQTNGSDGTVMWEVDQNGKIQLVEDASAVTRGQVESLLGTYDHFDRDSDVFSAEFAGIDTVGGRACYVIRVVNMMNDDVLELS
ncbi:hypothetical protein K8S17_03275, partial [bacterium]|nr:hypothetical protein [bacterium]